LGGIHAQKRYINHQNIINQLIQVDVNNNDKIKPSIYKQLINNIICKDVCFNLGTTSDELEKTTGADCIDVFVDKYMGKDERLVVIVKRIKKFRKSDILVGVLAIGTKSNNRWFAVDQSAMNKNQSIVEKFLLLHEKEKHAKNINK